MGYGTRHTTKGDVIMTRNQQLAKFHADAIVTAINTKMNETQTDPNYKTTDYADAIVGENAAKFTYWGINHGAAAYITADFEVETLISIAADFEAQAAGMAGIDIVPVTPYVSGLYVRS